MKKIIFYTIIFCCISLSACNDWLNVQPRTQIRRDMVFETENGFKDAIAGVYIKLGDYSAYGDRLTFTTVEHLVAHWETTIGTAEMALNNHDYKDATVKSRFSSIYLSVYNIISHLNAILEQIDAKKDVFDGINYELVKGEALALRAYCHLDILRLFGPMPTKMDNSITLPYVTTISKEPHQRLSYTEFTNALLDDLNKAEELLNKVDPVKDYSMSDVNDPSSGEYKPTDTFRAYRKFRMNYYAVLGLKARFYLWMQDKVNATNYAKMVIEAKNTDGSLKFELGGPNDFALKKYTLGSEHLFGLHKFDLSKISERLFESGSLNKERNDVLDDVFENLDTDVRFVEMWTTVVSSHGDSKFSIKKYWQQDGVDFENKEVIPLIRLSELYMIVMETTPLAEANEYYKTFRAARDNAPLSFTDELDRLNTIVKEFRREFYAEGQMFYTYKRLGISNMLWVNGEVDEKAYVIPLPDSEILSN